MHKNIAKVDGIPPDILRQLDDHTDMLRHLDFLEQLLEEVPLAAIAEELDTLCVTDGVVGIHYSRNFVEIIEEEGLVVCTGEERRREFLRRFGSKFTIDQRKRLITGWENYFDDQQNSARDRRIWFNLTAVALQNGGARPLLHHYGGEVISMPFKEDNEIAMMLHTMGTPMVVECALRSSQLTTFTESPWGRIWLSTYHCSVNGEAHQYDVDAYALESIPASDILAIRPVDEEL